MHYWNNTKTGVKWGVHDNVESVHVIPHKDRETPLPPHVFESECPCHPTVEDHCIFIHNMIH